MSLASVRVSRQSVALAALWIAVLAAGALAFRPGAEVGLTPAEYIARDAGVPGSDRVIATIDMPGRSRWGVMAYHSKGDMTCTIAGPMRHGAVGRNTPGGFEKFRLDQSPGSCADVAEDIRDIGGSGMISQSPVAPRSRELASVIYVVAGPDATAARLRMPDGRTRDLARTPVDGIEGAGYVFLAQLPPDHPDEGIVVGVTKRNGSTSAIRF